MKRIIHCDQVESDPGCFGLTFKNQSGESPGSLVVRILGFHCHGPGSIPGHRTSCKLCSMAKKKKKKNQSV